MVKLLKSYRPDGSSRAVWSDQTAAAFRRAGVIPQRASRVEVIDAGQHRGRFHVDLSLLADITGDSKLRVCLATPFDSYAAAVAAEVSFIERNWVL